MGTETERVCDYLDSKRSYIKRMYRSRTISRRIEKGIDGRVITVRTYISINTKTGTVSVAECIRYHHIDIRTIGIHSKYKCKEDDALTMWRKRRVSAYAIYKSKCISTKIYDNDNTVFGSMMVRTHINQVTGVVTHSNSSFLCEGQRIWV